MRQDKYILVGHEVVPCDDLYKWAKLVYGSDNRHVGDTKKGRVRVSTVFLGLDHSFGEGPPLLFETMVFGGDHHNFQDRCSTWDDAVEMHQRVCDMVWPRG